MNRDDVDIVTQETIKRLSGALTLAARKGKSFPDMMDTMTKLTLWLKSDNRDFDTWNKLTFQAGNDWLSWFDWYSQIKTRPMDDLGGGSLEDWYQVLNWKDES